MFRTGCRIFGVYGNIESYELLGAVHKSAFGPLVDLFGLDSWSSCARIFIPSCAIFCLFFCSFSSSWTKLRMWSDISGLSWTLNVMVHQPVQTALHTCSGRGLDTPAVCSTCLGAEFLAHSNVIRRRFLVNPSSMGSATASARQGVL